jgi:glycerate 2-kinase
VTTIDPRTLLRQMFDAAVASAQPSVAVAPHLPDPSKVKGRLLVIGAGKASASMARAVEDHWRGKGLDRVEGLVVTRYGYAVPCDRIEIIEAAHPVPDEAGLRASKRLMEFVRGLSADDVVLCLISGGGSSLLPLPAGGVTLEQKQALNKALLASGATITEMNCVRRHLSDIKGGRLAAACHPAKVITLLISDVPGDRPIDIASGPTVGDPTTCADALAIVRRYGIDLPPAAAKLLDTGSGESIKPDAPRLARATWHIVAAPQIALEAAADVARRAGYTPCILGDALEGEARDVGTVLAAIARQAADRGQPAAGPCVLLSGGETTVTLRGDSSRHGRGGRNVECLLAAAIALDGHPRIHALAADTDGVDGADEVAGAIATPDTIARAWARGLQPRDRLDAHDGHGFFGALGDAVITGPTMTNVNDFRAFVIDPPAG